MSSRAHKRPEPCSEENCGSRRFHVGDDGYTYCDRGHQQSHRGTVIAEDTGELVQLGRKQRRRDSDAESPRSRSRGFTGSQALEQYLLALQLILRKQVSWLITVANFPTDLEGITRDLWALRLRQLQGRVTYDSETDTEGQSQVFSSQSENESAASQTTRGSRRRRQAKTDGAINLSETIVICYLGALLLRVPCTVVDLISRIDDGALPYYRAGREVPGNLRERLPGQFQVLLEPQTVLQAPSLHRRILELGTLLSAEFGMVLPAVNHPLLLYRWMQDLALPIEVYAATQRLARLLGVNFTLHIEGKTSSNRVLRYPEVRLMALLIVSTKLFFPIDDIDRHPLSANDLSVLQMDWPAWVASHSSASNEDANNDTNEKDKAETTTHSMTFPEGFAISESDCLAMGNAELDRYLDWYEGNLASESVREHGRAGRDADFRRTLMRLFPTQSSSRPTNGDAASSLSSAAAAVTTSGEGRGGEDSNLAAPTTTTTATTQRLRQVQQNLRLKRILVSGGNKDGRKNKSQDGGEGGQKTLARVGDFYRRHREAKDLDGPTRLLYTKAAGLAGVSLEGMTVAVFATERKLQMREESARRIGEGDDEDRDEDEDEDDD